MLPALSLAFWIFLTTTSMLAYPVALLIWVVTSPFDPRKRLLHRFTCFWASLYTWFNPAWPVTVVDRHKIHPDVAYVMMANHQSLLDIFVVFRLFSHFKWVSKIENFKLPFVGWNMWLNGYIPLKRGDKASILQMLLRCREMLAAGNSIMMFPEGTRSPDGRIRRFKTGSFELAKNAQKPILPVVITGTADALPKRGFVLRGRHEIRIKVLDEIPYVSFAGESVEDLTQRVHDLIAGEIEKESPPRVDR